MPSGNGRDRHLAGWIALCIWAALALAATDGAVASPGSASSNDSSRATPAHTRVSNPPKRRVFLLGLRQRGRPGQFANRVSSPSSQRYRQFLSLRQYRKRFSPRRATRRRVRRYLASQRGVKKVELSSDRSLFLAVLTPGAGRRIFCAAGAGAPTRGLCTPPALRGRVRQISAGEVYQLGGNSRRGGAPGPANTKAGAPRDARARSRRALSRRTSCPPPTASISCAPAASLVPEFVWQR